MLTEHWSPSISDALEAFVLDCKAQRYSQTTQGFYRWRLVPALEWFQARKAKTVADVTPTLIRGYLVSLQERNLAAHTIHGAARAIRAFFNFCVREEFIPSSPMAKVAMPKLDKRILPAFSPADVRRLQSCADERERAVILFLLDTGVRASEFVRLDGDDVDMNTGEVRVRQGKGRKDRIVYMGATARKCLLRHWMRTEKPGAQSPLWRNMFTGKRLTTSGLRQLLRKLGTRAKVANCSPHTFRRTFALMSLRNGMSIYILARLMGHADITVLRQYLALTENDLAAAHERFGVVDRMAD